MLMNRLQILQPLRQYISRFVPVSLSVVLLGLVITVMVFRHTTLSTGQALAEGASTSRTEVFSLSRRLDSPLSYRNDAKQKNVADKQQWALRYSSQVPNDINQGKPTWTASNPGAQLRAFFYDDKVVISPSNTRDSWQFEMQFVQLAVADKTLNTDRVTVKVDANKIEYQRGIIDEWFINDANGIEHGFVIQDDILFHGQTSLSVTIEIDGLNIMQSNLLNDHNIALESKLNGGWLNYSKLKATDKTGHELAAKFSVNEHRITIDVDIRSAQFPVTIDPLITSNWVQLGNIFIGQSFGLVVESVGDVTGDGFDDVLVADPKAEIQLNDDVSFDRGTVYLYEGSATGLKVSPIWSYSETAVSTKLSDKTGKQTGASLGYQMAAAGDINADGFKDFIVAAPTYSTASVDWTGRVYIFFGKQGGVSALPMHVDNDNTMGGTNYGFGIALVDVNGDGRKDLLVGEPNYGGTAITPTDEGRLVVYLRNATVNPQNPQSLFNLTAPLSYASNNNLWGFADRIANAGDVNGDGRDDILVGVPGYSNGETTEGAAFYYQGVALGNTVDFATPDWTYESNQAGAVLGTEVAAAGDINSDSYADIVVSGWLWNGSLADQGIAYVFMGSANGLPSTPNWSYIGASTGASLSLVGSAGDVNGDGFGDLVVGVPFYANAEIDEGQVLVFEGSAAGLGVTPAWSYESNLAGYAAGLGVSGGGDFNGDGYSDIVVGAPGLDEPNLTRVGAAYAFHGAGNSDLSVVVTDSVDPISPGVNLTYTVQVTNAGPDPAKKVELKITLPAAAIFQSYGAGSGWTCSFVSPVVTCTQANINQGPANPVTVTARYTATAAAVTVLANVSANIIDGNAVNNSDSETTQVNTPPLANSFNIVTDEDVTYNASQPSQFLSGSDPDQNSITFSLNRQASQGVVTLNGNNGGFSYRPNSNSNGSDSFTFSVSDGIASSAGTVNVTINAINDAPATTNGAFTTDEDTVHNSSLTASDIDTALNQLTFSLNQLPVLGNVVINPNGSYTYTPALNANGVDSFTYNVTDRGLPVGTATGTVSITILAVNDPPLAIAQSITVLEDIPANGQLSATDAEIPSQLTFNAVAGTGPVKGTVVVLPNGSFTYIPTANATGQDSFRFNVADNGMPSLSATNIVSINIVATDDPPIAQSLLLITDEDTPVVGQLVASDLETPAIQLLYSLDVAPLHGRLSLQDNGGFTYTSYRDYFGSDSFVYKVQDNSSTVNSATATVSITINPINDAPRALDSNINIIQDHAWGGFLLGTDAETTVLQYALLTNPEKGRVEIYNSRTGGFTYTPNSGATGTDSFTFRISDGQLSSDQVAPGLVSVFINSAGSSNVPPSSPIPIAPDNGIDEVDATQVELSWFASIDPNDDKLNYSVVLCQTPSTTGCQAVPANLQQASLSYRVFAFGGTGSGLLLLGLLGANRRKRWQQVLILVTAIIFLGACSKAAEESQQAVAASFNKEAPEVITHVASQLNPATTYYWKIIVNDENGGEVESAIRNFVTKP